MTLKITWIAPMVPGLPALAWLNELGEIQNLNGVTVTAKTGDSVTLNIVANALLQPCDVLVWSGHGTAGGLALSDKSAVRANWLAAQISCATCPRVVILAACDSGGRDVNLRSLTETICRSGVTVIGFPADANDLAAGRFTVEFIRALAINASIARAFDVALESISNDATAAGVFLYAGIRDEPFDIVMRLEQIEIILDNIMSILTNRDSSTQTIAATPAKKTARSTGGIQPLTPATRGHVIGISGSSTN